jgi:CBS-domain-containing membrane protein
VIALAGACAAAFDEPLLFPSLGATAFLLFETPTAEVASPRNAMIGHTVAALAATGSLALFGLLDAPDAIEAGVTAERAAAVALSVGLTGGLLRLLRAAHPPAGATTIIVSIGLLTSAEELLTIVVAVAIVAGSGVLLNRLLGVPAPLWAAPR